jgi:hypothetical protein
MLAELYGTFTHSDGTICRRLPELNGSGCFLRAVGGLAAAVGTKQLDAAPNISGWWRGKMGNGQGATSGGAFTKSTSGTSSPASLGNGWNAAYVNFILNAGSANAVYGRRNEVAPVNYAVYFFIKY